MCVARHICIITHGGKVIATGQSQDTMFCYKGVDYRLHAECEAIRRLPAKYWNSRLVIDLVVIRNDMGESKPCEQCIQYMRSVPLRIRNISYSTRNGYMTEKLSYISNDLVTLYFRSQAHLKQLQQDNTHVCIYTPSVKCKCFSTYRYKCKHRAKSRQGIHSGL